MVIAQVLHLLLSKTQGKAESQFDRGKIPQRYKSALHEKMTPCSDWLLFAFSEGCFYTIKTTRHFLWYRASEMGKATTLKAKSGANPRTRARDTSPVAPHHKSSANVQVRPELPA
jgi:hypothetical protein